MGCYGVKNFNFKFLPVYHLVCTKQSITMNIVIFFLHRSPLFAFLYL